MDLAESMNFGLLSEMSFVELQERLSFLRATQAEEEELKRQEILQGKQLRDEVLQDKLTLIAKGQFFPFDFMIIAAILIIIIVVITSYKVSVHFPQPSLPPC